MVRKIITIILPLLWSGARLAAQSTQPEMADKFRADGKIYVVVLVLATIFVGIVAYLVRLDFKITKLEQLQKNSK
jgi:K+-transporting ATPase A subunit